MIIVSAITSCDGSQEGFRRWRWRPFPRGPSRHWDVVQYPFEEVGRFAAKKAFGRGSTIGTADERVVNSRQRGQLAGTDPMQVMMVQR